MIAFLGLPLWLWVVFGLVLVGAAVYFIRDHLRRLRVRLWSSPKVTSRTQCSEFSILQ